MAALGGNLYISDGNYNRVLKATLDGELSIFAYWEFSPVTVGIAAGPDGNLYVCQFSPAPYYPGNGRIDRVAPDGTITEGAVTNLTTPIDVAFAPDGTMYVLQYAAEFDNTIKRYVAFGGEVQRVNDDGSVAPVVTNLVFPTALTFGPDGALYVTNYGNESNDGQGQVLRVVPGDTPAPAPDVPPPSEEGSYVVPTREPISDESAEPTREPVATIDIVEPPGDPLEVWGYDPTELTVNVGDTVTFTNAGRIEHTATATNGDFDTGKLATDASWNVTFDEPGTIEYYCIPHPWMEGAITVVGQGSGDGQEEVASFGGDTDPPRISFWMAAVFVGVIIAAIFAAGYAMRRRGDVTSDGRVTSDE
jgi:plastocyanin